MASANLNFRLFSKFSEQLTNLNVSYTILIVIPANVTSWKLLCKMQPINSFLYLKFCVSRKMITCVIHYC